MGDAQLVPAPSLGTNFGVVQNRAWDGIWVARARRHDKGWTVEAQISFRTLNFDPNEDSWGANFQRTIRRKNEEIFWSAWGPNQGIYSLDFAGQIEGISDVSQGSGLDIKPYVLGNYIDVPGATNPTSYKGNAGIDVFYSLTPQIKANFTVNTDFAQTEVDDREVNLSRFPLFFPEKRDFFLEGSGNFDFARESVTTLTGFFTRRIGLDETTGRPQKIDYGTRLAGRAGRYNLGLMHVRTADHDGMSGEEFTVFRPKRLFLSQSYAGLMYTRRATRDSITPDRHSIGADFQLATAHFLGDRNAQFSGWIMATPNAAQKGDDTAVGARFTLPNDRWNLEIAGKYFGKNVDPAIGFIEQNDYRKTSLGLGFNPRPRNNRYIRQLFFNSRTELFTNAAGQWRQRIYNLSPFRAVMQSGDSVSVQITPTYDYLENDFRIRTGPKTNVTVPAGRGYQFTRYGVQMNTANQRKISGSANVTTGTFYSGTRRDLTLGLNLRPRRGLLATLSTTLNRVELPAGQFSTKTVRALVNTQFSPFVSVSNNIQYDTVSRHLGWQTRFRWILEAGNDLYIVWLNNWTDVGDRFITTDRSAAMKLTYTYRF
jgi:hypothetical protein